MDCTLSVFPVVGTAELWPYLLMLNIVPAFIVCVVLPFLPESPRYLMITKNRRGAAEKGTSHSYNPTISCHFVIYKNAH